MAGASGRRVVSLNSNVEYVVDNERKMHINKRTKKMMRPVNRIDKRTGRVKYKTYVNVVDTIPLTKAASKRARSAARRRKTRAKATTKKATTKKAKKGEPMVDSVRNYYVKLNPSNAGVARMKRVFGALETRRKGLFGR
jgi:hypothetical protein